MKLKDFFEKHKKRSAIIIFSIAFGIFAFGLLVTYVWICRNNTIVHEFIQESGKDYSSKNCNITMNIPIRADGKPNQWEESDGTWGAQYDIYINNNSNAPFCDWIVELEVPENCRIDSSWNGFYEFKENTISITPTNQAMNHAIQPKNNVRVGFVLYSPFLLESCNLKFRGHFVTKLFKNPFFIVFLALAVILGGCLISSIVVYYSVLRATKSSDEKIDALLKLCANFIDTRDEYTKMHSFHVALYSKKIAQAMGYDEDFQKNIYYVGMLHDVGKVLIPLSILCKKDKLTEEEWTEMKKHTTYGADILQDFIDIPHVKDAVLYHHERFDGNGYMDGLKGEEIPMVARIICVADSYDAMATNRSYRKHLPREVIIQELKKNAGTQFDPKISRVMVELLNNGKI